jgi:hypothetical protein
MFNFVSNSELEGVPLNAVMADGERQIAAAIWFEKTREMNPGSVNAFSRHAVTGTLTR